MGVVGIAVADKAEGPVVVAVDETARPTTCHSERGHDRTAEPHPVGLEKSTAELDT